jgi:hypothetical protein
MDAYGRWRRQDPIVLRSEDHRVLEALAQNLPAVWNAATTKADEKKRILRLIIQEVLLDQTSDRGQVLIKIIWQTGALSEHKIARHVHSYADYVDHDLLRRRITELNADGLMDKQIAAVLNAEGVLSARRRLFTYANIWLLRQRWGLPAVKFNPVGANPARWPDGSYSVQGAASALGVTPQTIFDYLARGLLRGRQLTKGQPWQIDLIAAQIASLQERLQHIKRSRRTAP